MNAFKTLLALAMLVLVTSATTCNNLNYWVMEGQELLGDLNAPQAINSHDEHNINFHNTVFDAPVVADDSQPNLLSDPSFESNGCTLYCHYCQGVSGACNALPGWRKEDTFGSGVSTTTFEVWANGFIVGSPNGVRHMEIASHRKQCVYQTISVEVNEVYEVAYYYMPREYSFESGMAVYVNNEQIQSHSGYETGGWKYYRKLVRATSSTWKLSWCALPNNWYSVGALLDGTSVRKVLPPFQPLAMECSQPLTYTLSGAAPSHHTVTAAHFVPKVEAFALTAAGTFKYRHVTQYSSPIVWNGYDSFSFVATCPTTTDQCTGKAFINVIYTSAATQNTPPAGWADGYGNTDSVLCQGTCRNGADGMWLARHTLPRLWDMQENEQGTGVKQTITWTA